MKRPRTRESYDSNVKWVKVHIFLVCKLVTFSREIISYLDLASSLGALLSLAAAVALLKTPFKQSHHSKCCAHGFYFSEVLIYKFVVLSWEVKRTINWSQSPLVRPVSGPFVQSSISTFLRCCSTEYAKCVGCAKLFGLVFCGDFVL